MSILDANKKDLERTTKILGISSELLAERYEQCDDHGHYAPNNPQQGK